MSSACQQPGTYVYILPLSTQRLRSNRFIYRHGEACLIFVVLYMCCYVKYVEAILRLPRCFIQCDIGIKMIC
ncbi:hypothetical protein PAHAL_4G101800 [Panicum hallii]|uniref:Uncharacterized protein n=1 Tax=Panicum hallii TaxID=206008 RepID=A0A2T8JCG5_9POAL|nr:hypothetical protein PAHAL_4G101800 [Panicum hallii]